MKKVDQAFVDLVRSTPGLVALCGVIGRRLAVGDSVDAYRMLVDVGATPAKAHELVEGWIDSKNARLGEAGISPELEAALRFASHIEDFERFDWTALLSRAVDSATRARRESHESEKDSKGNRPRKTKGEA